jgi:carboxyl-terminal processing protease
MALLASGALMRPLSAADGTSKLYSDYINAVEIVRSNYIEPLEYDVLNKMAIQNMLHTLDPHSNFYDRKAFDEMRSEQRSQYYGIGATIGGRDRGVYVLEPHKGAPATRAGLRYGDQIVMIDGKNVEKESSEKIKNLLRGEQGTKVRVSVKRPGVAEPVTVTIERESIEYPSILTSYLARPGIGYIALTRGFHSTTSDELTSAMSKLKEQGATSLILDLRGNPGGFLNEAVEVCDKFLQRGQAVVSIRGRDDRFPERNMAAESGSPDTSPLVILINNGSASASEIVAGAIQDHDRGLVVGENSFGKGLVQTIIPLSGGAGLTLTTQRYYTPSGRLIQRDYSSGSAYEYFYKRQTQGTSSSTPKPSQEQKRTDLGREVASGGGIDPDVKVDGEKLTRAQVQIWNTGLFMFVRELVGGQIAAAPNFKLGPIDFNHQLKPNEFMITDEILSAYRAFMTDFIRSRPEWGITQAAVDDHLIWARKQIREEVFQAAYGSGIAQRALADLDLQLQRAITELPNAAELAERARVARRSSRD